MRKSQEVNKAIAILRKKGFWVGVIRKYVCFSTMFKMYRMNVGTKRLIVQLAMLRYS